MEQAKLKEILEKHKKWLNNEEGGESAYLSRADLSGAYLSGATLRRADLSGAYLSGANLRRAYLSGAYLSCADLSGAYLSCADLSGAYLSCADLSGADLSCANLSRADLSRADLRRAYLSGADLSGADLRRAYLSGADLSGADLSGAYLSGADLSRADLSGAYLSRADLSGAYLSGATLSRADLSGAYLSGATGLLNPIDYLAETFERTEGGYVVYKVFNGCYEPPAKWKIEPGEVITEEVNFYRVNECGCGINAAPLEFVKRNFPGKDIYKLLIKWEWLAGVVVPYNTDGKIRCSRALIIGKVENDG